MALNTTKIDELYALNIMATYIGMVSFGYSREDEQSLLFSLMHLFQKRKKDHTASYPSGT